MNTHGNAWYARHLEKGTDQHGCLQMFTILEKQVFLGLVVPVCNPSVWEMEGKSNPRSDSATYRAGGQHGLHENMRLCIGWGQEREAAPKNASCAHLLMAEVRQEHTDLDPAIGIRSG